jgi:hypothetical protein
MAVQEMNVPKEIKIGPYTYRVFTGDGPVQAATEDAGMPVSGYCNHQNLTIVIDTDAHPAVVADTVLHEVMHALFHQTGMSHLVGDSEEQLVASLSTALLDALRRNPKLVPIITGGRS